MDVRIIRVFSGGQRLIDAWPPCLQPSSGSRAASGLLFQVVSPFA